MPKLDLPGTRGSTAGPPADPRRPSWTYQQQLHQSAAYIGCHALVLGHVVAASARGNLPSLLERLSERSMASVLIGELNTVANDVKRSQLEDAVGSS